MGVEDRWERERSETRGEAKTAMADTGVMSPISAAHLPSRARE